MIRDAQADYDASAPLKGHMTTAERERRYAAALDRRTWVPGPAEAPSATTTPEEQQ